MRSLKLSLLLVLCILVAPLADASTVVKVGSECKKVKELQKIGQDILICTKVDGKLTWQPSVAQIEERIWTDLQSRRSAMPDAAASLEIHFSPTVNKKIANVLLNGVNQAAKLWQVQYLPEKPLPTLLFTEKDRDWFISEMKSLNVYSENQLSHFDDEVKRNKDRANWAGVTGDGGRIWMTYMIGTGKKAADSLDAQVAAHEYTHLAQNAIASDNFDALTCWQVEGGAAFYGLFLGVSSKGQLAEFTKQRNTSSNFGGWRGVINQSPSGWEKLLDSFGPNYNHYGCGPDGAYQVGGIANEYLYSLKGHDGIIAMLTATSKDGNFQSAIEKTFGKPWPTIRKEMSNYLKLVVAQN